MCWHDRGHTSILFIFGTNVSFRLSFKQVVNHSIWKPIKQCAIKCLTSVYTIKCNMKKLNSPFENGDRLIFGWFLLAHPSYLFWRVENYIQVWKNRIAFQTFISKWHL